MPFWPVSYFSLPCPFYSSHAASLLFLEHAKPAPTLGPLHCLADPLPGTLFLQISAQLTTLPPLPHQDFAHMPPCKQDWPWLPYLNLEALTHKPGNSEPHYSVLSLFPTALITFIILYSLYIMLVVYDQSPWEQESLNVFQDCRTVPWNTAGTQKVYV